MLIDDRPAAWGGSAERVTTDLAKNEGSVAVPTNLAPMMAQHSDPMRDAMARAAAKAGMTVEAWIAHTDRIEAAERSRRIVDRTMRQAPRYRGAAA
ncbi:hypothetical protein [Microbacterium sp. MMO-10]|uniref:hypothetical protein n=1 Tax=Microbacterium sp. MMO-10 TaxID=3081272 RepID=UPI00301886B8